MGFDMGDFDYDSGGGFGPYEAEVINAGLTQGKYGAQAIFVCKPTNPQRRTQTLFMGMGKEVYVFGGASEVIVTGEGEKAFENTIQKEIVSGPKIKVMTKAGLFLNALKHLGFKLAGADVTVCIGLVLDLEEIKFNEAIRRFNEAHPDSTLQELSAEYGAAKITIPTKIISMPIKKVSLKEAVLEVIEGKTEAEMEAWYKGTERYDGTVTPLYHLLAELEKTEVLVVNDKYLVKKEEKK
jgi:hypothetical protein